MIKTRQELKEYIDADRSRYSKITFISHIRYFLGIENDAFRATKYLKVLRHLEYHDYNKSRSFISKTCYIYYMLRHLRLSNKFKLFIGKNIVGKGLRIAHTDPFIVLQGAFKIGDYCTVNRGAHVGIKGLQENRSIIGNNVEITTGAKIIGKVIIGDNAVVCPNSVVIKDVPANAIVSGVPAQIVKIRDCK